MNLSKTAAQKLTPSQLIAQLGGVSAAIRGLDQLGFTRSEIAAMLEKRYQHVRNILVTPVTKQKVKVQPVMSDEFKKALEQGL
jgi:hypothetical protein